MDLLLDFYDAIYWLAFCCYGLAIAGILLIVAVWVYTHYKHTRPVLGMTVRYYEDVPEDDDIDDSLLL